MAGAALLIGGGLRFFAGFPAAVKQIQYIDLVICRLAVYVGRILLAFSPGGLSLTACPVAIRLLLMTAVLLIGVFMIEGKIPFAGIRTIGEFIPAGSDCAGIVVVGRIFPAGIIIVTIIFWAHLILYLLYQKSINKLSTYYSIFMHGR